MEYQKEKCSMRIQSIKKVAKIMIITIIIIIAVLFIIFLATVFVPVKFCLSSLPTGDEEFYVVRYIYERNRSVIIGDNTGMYEEGSSPERLVHIEGNNFNNILSRDIVMHTVSTTFIVRGDVRIDEEWDKKYYGDTGDAILYTITCTSWDILGKIETYNWWRSIFPKSYLNIYDYIWFDNLRYDLGIYYRS